MAAELREYSAGDWTGSQRDQLSPEIYSKMNILNNSFLPPNGESLNQVERRASQWLENKILYNPDVKSDILVFSHGMTIKCLIHYILGFDQSFTWKIKIDNTSITSLKFDQNGWHLLKLNDTSHLDRR